MGRSSGAIAVTLSPASLGAHPLRRAMDSIKCGPNLWAIITRAGSSLSLGGVLGGQGDKQDFLPKMLGQTLALVLKGDSAG